jgi:hypothetical protein
MLGVDSVNAAVKSVLAFCDGESKDLSLDGFAPSDPGHFGFNAQIFIGTDEDDRFDSFDVVVCSPSWLADEVSAGKWSRFQSGQLRVIPESIVVGAGIWFMCRWDRAEFDEALRSICAAASPGPDWGSVASRIGRLIPWEFGYRYDDHINDHYGEPFPPAP